LDELTALFDRPAWQANAACRDHPEVSWFPSRGEDVRPAQTICAGCAVRAECLEFALMHEPDDRSRVGIWGGTSARQRRPLIPRNQTAECAELDDAEWLRRRYVVQGRTMREIARELRCGNDRLRNALRRHGLI